MKAWVGGFVNCGVQWADPPFSAAIATARAPTSRLWPPDPRDSSLRYLNDLANRVGTNVAPRRMDRHLATAAHVERGEVDEAGQGGGQRANLVGQMPAAVEALHAEAKRAKRGQSANFYKGKQGGGERGERRVKGRQHNNNNNNNNAIDKAQPI